MFEVFDDFVDPRCDELNAVLKAELGAMPTDMDGASAYVAKGKYLSWEHGKTCEHCRAYGRSRFGVLFTMAGAALGLVFGLLLGFFRDDYRQTAIDAIIVGAAIGISPVLISWVVDTFRNRS